jgi:hypothetical protein
MSRRADHLRGDQQVGAGAAAEVEHDRAFLDPPERVRIGIAAEAPDARIRTFDISACGYPSSSAQLQPVGKMKSAPGRVETSVKVFWISTRRTSNASRGRTSTRMTSPRPKRSINSSRPIVSTSSLR